MKQHRLFGRKITFNESFSHVVYIDRKSELVDKRLYDQMEIDEVNVIKSADGDKRFVSSYRKAVTAQHEIMEGIIIGQTKKLEGLYSPGYKGTWYDGYHEPEHAYLDVKKTIRYWVVAVGMNKTMLVEKDLFI